MRFWTSVGLSLVFNTACPKCALHIWPWTEALLIESLWNVRPAQILREQPNKNPTLWCPSRICSFYWFIKSLWQGGYRTVISPRPGSRVPLTSPNQADSIVLATFCAALISLPFWVPITGDLRPYNFNDLQKRRQGQGGRRGLRYNYVSLCVQVIIRANIYTTSNLPMLLSYFVLLQ